MPNPMLVDVASTPPRLFERVRLVKMQPGQHSNTAAFDDIMDVFEACLKRMGSAVDRVINGPFLASGVNLVFGADLVRPDLAFPSSCVLVNLEQLGGRMLSRRYIERLVEHPVLDYSPSNVRLLARELDVSNVHLFEIGYAPEMTRIPAAPEQDVDVLFYGVVNPRRRAVLDTLEAAGLKLKVLEDTYGAERDAWVARAKLVLNIRYYESKRHEIVRTSYLLANRKAVVSECDPDTDIDADIKEAVAAVPVDGLVETCRALLADDAKRHALERRGFEIFSRRDQTASLRAALDKVARPHPRRINLGSGKAWDPERLNIDIEPRWKPDVLGDITKGLHQIYFSKRFGLVRLEPGGCDEITVMDVLEHVPDLPGFMRQCIDMLAVGGVMRIGVPYDLSFGAWQDPTHVRAFNERSWLYYTEWHWYLGWTNWRFDVAELRYRLSEFGQKLKDRLPLDELTRTPRAVDAMDVVLRKRALTDDEKLRAEAYVAGPARR